MDRYLRRLNKPIDRRTMDGSTKHSESSEALRGVPSARLGSPTSHRPSPPIYRHPRRHAPPGPPGGVGFPCRRPLKAQRVRAGARAFKRLNGSLDRLVLGARPFLYANSRSHSHPGISQQPQELRGRHNSPNRPDGHECRPGRSEESRGVESRSIVPLSIAAHYMAEQLNP